MTKKKKSKVVKMLSPESYVRQKARTLPIHECWVNKEWKEDGLATLTIARKHTNGNFTLGIYLVDLKCLGIKDAHYFFNIYLHEYQEILDQHKLKFEIEKIDYTLAHNIIYAGIEYAEDYGFKPHKDFEVAKYIVEEDTEGIELLEITCGGSDGQPLYIRGPLDTDMRSDQIIAQLEKTAGTCNYHFIDGALYDEEEGDDWDEDEIEEMVLQETNEDEIKNSQTFQFKIQLDGISNPPVWRTVTVPSYYTFLHFHYVIQAAFGWMDSHLFQFSEKGYGPGTIITQIYEDFEADLDDQVEAESIKLSEVFKTQKQKLIYLYDFGDSWKHNISLEKILSEPSLTPGCLAGKGKCPPEDCGGCWGYMEMKETMKNKSHPEYEEFMEWLGLAENETWDPHHFDLAEINKTLK